MNDFVDVSELLNVSLHEFKIIQNHSSGLSTV